nr:MBL fold metallo-hydrolase [Caldimonas sp.]
MKLIEACVVACCAVAPTTWTAAIAAERTTASAASVEAHVEAAHRAAGSDLAALVTLCKPASPTPMTAEQVDRYLASQIALPAPPPGRAFDNLYFVGGAWVSAWALTTSEGIILIDALDNEAEASTLIEGGLRRLGLDPAQIRVIIVTHGHGDHYGGVPYLVDKYRARVVMSDRDWTMMATKLDFESKLWPPPPQRDLTVTDGEKVRLGDTTVTIHLTPGHTVGTVSPTFEVRDASGVHRVLLWGGTSFNFGRKLDRLDAYIDSTERMAELVAAEKIDVLISNHSGFDGAVEKLERRRAAAPGAPNPFVLGTPAVLRALTVMGECARAQRDRYLSSPG